jgi:hypothetical protein
MATWVFRQSDGPEIRERLFEEAKHGRLRQGWSYGRELSLEADRAVWLREYRKAGYNAKHQPEPTHDDLVKMLNVLPGDMLVVPKQPNDDAFFIARAVANPWGEKSPCYCFLKDHPVKSEWGDDFRSCLTIEPGSIRKFSMADAKVPDLLRKAFFGQGAWYRSKIQRIARKDVNRALFALGETPRTEASRRDPLPRIRIPAADSRKLLPFLPLADTNYFQVIQGGTVVRSREHQTLVNVAASQLESAGATLVRKGRIDLFISKPVETIIEVKMLRGNAIQAMREGIGQLFWYRFEQGLPRASLCLLLDRRPSDSELDCLETGVGISAIWKAGQRFYGRSLTLERLGGLRWLEPEP